MSKKLLADLLLHWYDQHKRSLPWRDTKDPYKIWVSEIMLQQTRVDTVIPYYNRFLAQLPTVRHLAEISEEPLLKLWEGLGYYSRVRNMQKAAQILVRDYNEQLPASFDQLQHLPGIGPYTAGAISSIAFSLPVPAIDGNVLRVFSRLFEVEKDITFPKTKKTIFSLVESHIDAHRPGDFNQAIMDLGAGICIPVLPQCSLCPLKTRCQSYASHSQERYPVKLPKAPPRSVSVAVGLFIYKNQILVQKRTENLLKGLWLFPLVEGDDTEDALVETYLTDIPDISIRSLGFLESARHIFTHKIWEMNIYGFSLSSIPDHLLGQWVSLSELHRLPMPTAVKSAKKLAQHYLSRQQ